MFKVFRGAEVLLTALRPVPGSSEVSGRWVIDQDTHQLRGDLVPTSTRDQMPWALGV